MKLTFFYKTFKFYHVSIGRLLILLFSFSALPVQAQLSERTNNESKGDANSFTITINSTHGIQTNASRTPDFKVETFGKMVVGPNSTSIQENKDGSSAFLQSTGTTAEGQTSGVSGMQRINFGEGTEYQVKIIPKSDSEICPEGATECTIPNLGTASGSSTGTTSTSITVSSSQSTFVNSFVKSFTSN